MTPEKDPHSKPDLDAEALIALDEARRMKPGPERTEAMKRAGILRNAVDLQGLSFARRGRQGLVPSDRCVRQPRLNGAEHLLERLPERDIDIRHAHGMAEIDQTGDAVARIRHAAGHDGIEMGQVGLDIDRNAVE